MIQSANDYDFTTVSTPGCVSGAGFADAMCPRLEQLLWLNEAVKTAERRGGFNPLTGAFPAAGAKNDPAVMVPDIPFLTNFQSRINAVLTVPYHDIDSIPAGIVNSLSGTYSVPGAVAGGPYTSSVVHAGTAALSSVVSSALVTPQAVTFPALRMWPSRGNFGAYSTAVSRAVGDVNFHRSAVYGSFFGGLDRYISKGPTDRTMYRNGTTGGNYPIRDWELAPYDCPHPLLNETGKDYIYNTDHTIVDYYRFKCDTNEITYSLESSSWGFPIDLPSWTHTGVLAALKQTSVVVVPIWGIIAAPLWRETNTTTPVLTRDRTISYFTWIGNPNGSMGQLASVRNTTGQYFYHPASQLSSLVKVFGDYILANAVNLDTLPSSGMMGGGSGSRVGYVAHVFCIGAVYIATVASRDIGS